LSCFAKWAGHGATGNGGCSWSLLVVSSREEPMENSIHEARWLLGTVFAVSITFLAIGVITS
ncbi:hypothetical protein, partial [Mesorhizobium sp.]|uniref:hypothetical protein n=1 Tax=Mesorhizobium sp. TaxID=1871066 RepID=UPI0025BE77E3